MFPLVCLAVRTVIREHEGKQPFQLPFFFTDFGHCLFIPKHVSVCATACRYWFAFYECFLLLLHNLVFYLYSSFSVIRIVKYVFFFQAYIYICIILHIYYIILAILYYVCIITSSSNFSLNIGYIFFGSSISNCFSLLSSHLFFSLSLPIYSSVIQWCL